MIQTPTLCPPDTELIDYLLGKLPEDQWPVLESHFQDCRVCEETMRELSASDTLSQFAGQAAASIDSEPDDLPIISGLIERLQRTTRDRSRDLSALHDRANEVIQLLDDPHHPDSPGQLGEYRIEELIGAGSTGVVFRVIDRQLGRRVALKVLRPSLGDAARRRFMAEARAAASIEHPNVITIWQVGQHNALAFIAMQWLPGETLEDRLARVTVVSEDEVRDIAGQVAAGLRAAQMQTLIHRDIKPANIWLCEASDQAIILDFGLARIADDDPHMTSTGMLAGTPNFMSPEQTRGQELDGRSDLFSLGCLMYRAATGKLPFGAGGVLATLQSIQHHQPPLPRELNPNLSPDFSDLIMCLLEKQPANRPANANDLIRALGQARESWPFAATRYSSQPTIAPITVQPQPTSGSRSRRWIIAATLATLLAAGAYAFGQQIIRIATNRGEIVIETDDENVQVEILSGGEIVKIVDTSTQQRIDIQAGEYEITAHDPNNANGEFKISSDHIVLTRGGRQVVSVQLVERGNENKSAILATTEPMYEGRTFDDWVNELSRERSQAAVQTGFTALGELSRGDATKQERAIEVATPLIRIHGSVNNQSGWPDVFNAFLSCLSPQRVVRFAIDEIQNGTGQSRSQSIWLLIVGTIYEGQEELQAKHRAAIRENLNRIVDAGCDYIENDTSGTDNETIKRLMSDAIKTSISTSRQEDGQRVYDAIVVDNVPHLVKRLTTTDSSEVREFLVKQLMSFYANSVPIVSNGFHELLGVPGLSSELAGAIYFNHVTRLIDFPFDESRYDQVIPLITRIFESDQLCEKVWEFYASNWPTPASSGGGRDGGRGVDPGGIGGLAGGGGGGQSGILNSDPPSEGESEDDPKTAPRPDAIRADILFRIGSQSKFASPALPWLDRIATSDSPLIQHATIAARKIRGEVDQLENDRVEPSPADPARERDNELKDQTQEMLKNLVSGRISR